nr:serine/threonine-protein kinase srpk [Quercus suber]
MNIRKTQHVALKLYVRSESMGTELDTELSVYRRIERAPEHHPGRYAVRSLLDSFDVDGPCGQHRCLVHTPLWESALKIKHRNAVGRLPVPVVAFLLKRLFHALDFLHEECHVAHTDIKEANILLGADSSVLTEIEHEELREPSPSKEIDGGIVYLSRKMGTLRAFGAPVLCDFGSAVPLDDGREHCEDIQPDIYRSPEVILDIPWTYSVDIWNVGCEHLFTGRNPELGVYRGRAHLAEMIALLGPPPPHLLARANLARKFFSEEGIPVPCPRTLEDRETSLRGEESKTDRESFLRFMRKMLQWEPEQRSCARDLAEDEWILRHAT